MYQKLSFMYQYKDGFVEQLHVFNYKNKFSKIVNPNSATYLYRIRLNS